MKILKHKSLKELNTFGIDVNAEHFIIINHENELTDLLKKGNSHNFKILGGGSNLLLTQNIKGTLLKNEIKGIDIVLENEDEVLVRVGGGENWHEFVMWAVARNYGGIENLSLIPGTVGAAPIQNIGAYGVELKDVFEGLNFIHFENGKEISFNHKECNFAYRNSIFKNELKGKIFISRVFFRLSKPPHKINISYGAIKDNLEEKGIKNPSIKNISDTIIEIRESKLPNPAAIGNSGSFFKNPEIKEEEFKKIKNKFPNIPSYPMPNNMIKIPAAWLIDQCQLKGVRYGNTGCYKNQPLVLVNYGNATGEEIKSFSERVQGLVKNKFGISISPEVNIW